MFLLFCLLVGLLVLGYRLKIHYLNNVALLYLPRTSGFLGALGFVVARCRKEKQRDWRDLQVSVLSHLSFDIQNFRSAII